jgi:L-fucose/D-arabinose isomerase
MADMQIFSHPKIGIRPIIDGRRRGIRESLEDQTMGIARRTAEFLSANSRYPDGLRVQLVCIIWRNRLCSVTTPGVP